jgi:hypothetical protein
VYGPKAPGRRPEAISYTRLCLLQLSVLGPGPPVPEGGDRDSDGARGLGNRYKKGLNFQIFILLWSDFKCIHPARSLTRQTNDSPNRLEEHDDHYLVIYYIFFVLL